MLIDKVIGVGEVAIADWRSSQPSAQELARVVASAAIGGAAAGKAGVTHFHVGPADSRLSLLHRLLDEFDVRPRHVYPTHVTRTAALLDDAVALARRGAYVDTDVVEPGLARWLRRYRENGGPPGRFTVSSDAHTPGGSPAKLYREFVTCARDEGMPLEEVLPHFATNTADVLRLRGKGRLRPGADADMLVVRRRSLELVHVLCAGRRVVNAGAFVPVPAKHAEHAEHAEHGAHAEETQ
jgi:beta-aspartyl-dipeptidase (metallo-type)